MADGRTASQSTVGYTDNRSVLWPDFFFPVFPLGQDRVEKNHATVLRQTSSGHVHAGTIVR